MMRGMSVRVVSARELKGPAWAEKYPDKAQEIWVFAIANGKRKKVRIGPPTDENRALAERKRREWEILIERRALGQSQVMAPLLVDAIDEFAKFGMTRRAWKTRSQREYQLGVLAREFGELALDTIDAEMLWKYCSQQIDDGKSIRTVTGYLDALSQLYQFHARTLKGLVNPTDQARVMLRDGFDTTAAFRAMNDENCNPLRPREMAKLLAGLRDQSNRDLESTVLLCYEAGLRIGEAMGLQWGDVWWGESDEDTTRSVSIQRSREGNHVGLTKSGRSRKVSISRRLRAHLMQEFLRQGSPDPDEWVIQQHWAKNARERLARAARRAKIRPLKFKDLRDTYATTLCGRGINLRWISRQLGHGSVVVTERHYARFLGADGYQNPWIVPAGMLPSDMFAELERLVPQESPQLPQTVGGSK